MLQRILVWDMPTRVFHWLLALSFAGAFLTAETERYRDIHLMLGYTFLGAIIFRIIWGFVGTRYARFRSFLFQPGKVMRYVRSLFGKAPEHHIGHNPAGAVAIFLILGLGILIGLSGILLYFEVGGDVFEELHEVVANTMLLVVAIHIAGVVVSSMLHHENLVRAMITGYKAGEANQAANQSFLWLGILLLVAVVIYWVGTLSA